MADRAEAGKQMIIRVFPRRTSYTPIDKMAFVGMPPFKSMIPKHNVVGNIKKWRKKLTKEIFEKILEGYNRDALGSYTLEELQTLEKKTKEAITYVYKDQAEAIFNA